VNSIARKLFPFLEWAKGYDGEIFGNDLAAGLTVGVMLIPQSMAYAMLAGMPPRFGLYAGFVPLLVYPFLGTSRHLSVGPVAIDMLIVSAGVGALAANQGEHIQLAILVAAMTGLLEILMGLLGFGFFVNFLSRPVIAGFMTAAPLIIAASQLDSLMGVELVDSQYAHLKIWSALQHLGEINAPTLAVGLGGISFLAGLQYWRPKWPSALLWVIVATGATWALQLDQSGLAIVRGVPDEIPGFEVPAWSLSTIVDLGPTAVTLALVQFMSVMSLGQAFAADHDYSIDANRELIAIGATNLIGSAFRSIPVSGSFSRSAVNNRAGAETPVTNLVAASLVGLALLFLTPLFFYLPKAALAAIIIVACVGMVDVPELRRLLETRWIDGAVALVTFAATLGIGIQQGILIGIGISIVVVLYDLTRPDIVELGHIPETQEFRDLARNPEAEPIPGLKLVRVDSRFSFANAKVLKDELLEEVEDEEPIRALIIDTSGVNDLDTTAVRALRDVVDELTEAGVDLYVAGAKGTIRDVLRASGLTETIGESNFFLNPHQAVSTVLDAWDEREKYEPAGREQRRDEMVEARERLEEERARVERNRRDIHQERRRLKDEIARHEEERDELDVARDELRRHLERAEQRRDKLHEEREALEESRRRLDEREEQLDERERELESRRETLDEREHGLDRQEEKLETERDLLEADREELLEERDELDEELDELHRERDELEEARQQLREELERAEQRRSDLREERRKIEQEREELESERRRLEAEREKASGDGAGEAEDERDSD